MQHEENTRICQDFKTDYEVRKFYEVVCDIKRGAFNQEYQYDGAGMRINYCWKIDTD
jgi:hypothetical protein